VHLFPFNRVENRPWLKFEILSLLLFFFKRTPLFLNISNRLNILPGIAAVSAEPRRNGSRHGT
jgi:hypothetical protein